jgi:DNA mismatch repair protein MutL
MSEIRPIQVLPDDIASQIAAGEVIERPASVVKELLENSLDAGATQIDITVEAAGKQKIVVYDNGSGINPEQLVLAVSRHATSKLREAKDLFEVSSLGFRGEALASIGSVSRLTISSQTSADKVGGRLKVEGGKIGQVQKVGLPVGTTVSVEALFYNVPARLKFLKTDRTERSRIGEIVSRYALGYPGVRFTLTMAGKRSVQTNGSGDRQEVFAAEYGPQLMRRMLLVHAENVDMRIEGLISPTSYTRSNRKEISFFINGRWVQDPALTAAVLQAYHTMLMTGRYPLAALFIEMPADLVDVNVHPAKSEVRFNQKDRVFSAVQRAVRRAWGALADIGTGSNPVQAGIQRLGSG